MQQNINIQSQYPVQHINNKSYSTIDSLSYFIKGGMYPPIHLSIPIYSILLE